MARLASPHQRTGAVAGLCTSKVGKRLERRRGSGICPVLMVLIRAPARSRDFATAKSESDSRRGRTSGAAERQRDGADIEAAETPGEGTAGAPAQGLG